MEKPKKLYIAGHTGLVGSSLVRLYKNLNNVELVLVPHSELDLTRQKELEDFFSQTKPHFVINAAGKVGGIQANSEYPAQFIYENLMIEANLVHCAWKSGVQKFLNFGSSCIYPKQCPQPMKSEMLMTGKLESTNEAYAFAKLAGLSLCSSYQLQYRTTLFINAIPSNLYGPGDNFDLEWCHVVAALIRRFHEAKSSGQTELTLWGTGKARRDFLYVEDFAKACHLLLEKHENSDPINLGAEAPCSIHDLAFLLAQITGFKGKILWDNSRPDGNPERYLEASEIKKLGWSAETSLEEGLLKTYQWFLENYDLQTKKGTLSCASL